MHSNRQFVAEMLRAGATGYVLKERVPDELVQAIRAVTQDKSYLSPKITGIIIEDYVKCVTTVADLPLSVLTSREHRVLQLIAEGKSHKQNALDLQVSIKTIEVNRRQIMEKLNTDSIADLVKIAINENMAALEL